MYVPNITLSLPTPLDECNNVYAPLQDQLSMGFMVTNYESIIRYNNWLPSYPRIDIELLKR
jgi:hypothetical protein